MATQSEGTGTLLLDDQTAHPVSYAFRLDQALLQGYLRSNNPRLPQLHPLRLRLSDGVSFVVVELQWSSTDRREWQFVYDLRAVPDQPDDSANLLRGQQSART